MLVPTLMNFQRMILKNVHVPCTIILLSLLAWHFMRHCHVLLIREVSWHYHALSLSPPSNRLGFRRSPSLDPVDLIPEVGDPLEAGEVGDGVHEEEAVAATEELLAHGAILLLTGSIEHCKEVEKKSPGRGGSGRDS